MNKGLISGLVLLVFGLVCGVLLAGVNAWTAPIIQKEEQNLNNKVIGEFYNLDNYTVKTVEISTDSNFGSVTVHLFDTDYDVKVLVKTMYELTGDTDGKLDAIVYLVEAYGYNTTDPIQMMIAVNSDLTIKDYKVVYQQETSGFGSKIVDKDFGVTNDNINDLSNFDGISGVTYSSKAVLACFTAVQERTASDFGGGSSD